MNSVFLLSASLALLLNLIWHEFKNDRFKCSQRYDKILFKFIKKTKPVNS